MLALAKGIREPHKVKKKSFDLGGNRFPPVGLIAQMVEQCTGIADVMGLNPFKFFSGFNFVAA